MKRILVTGGSGFIGSHYIRYLLERHKDVQVINADALTYSANPYNLADVVGDDRYTFVRVDLSDPCGVEQLFRGGVDEVVHFAAESHVDRSIEGSEPFIRSNILGTYRLLEAVRQSGRVRRMVHISTDEVYGSVPEGRTPEGSPLAPGNPYSASKASSDLLCLSYRHTHGIPVIITRCTNNYGPHQHPEKLIPRLILRALDGKPLPLYGNGRQERDWLHVQDHCEAVDLVRLAGRPGEVYHIGAEHPVPNIRVAEHILDILGKPRSLIRHVEDRRGHDVRYSLDTAKIRGELNWRPRIPFGQGLKETVEWYRCNEGWLESTGYSREK